MKNTWGDPLTDALQADKAERDRDLEEAREVARYLLWLVGLYLSGPMGEAGLGLRQVRAKMDRWPAEGAKR